MSAGRKEERDDENKREKINEFLGGFLTNTVPSTDTLHTSTHPSITCPLPFRPRMLLYTFKYLSHPKSFIRDSERGKTTGGLTFNIYAPCRPRLFRRNFSNSEEDDRVPLPPPFHQYIPYAYLAPVMFEIIREHSSL